MCICVNYYYYNFVSGVCMIFMKCMRKKNKLERRNISSKKKKKGRTKEQEIEIHAPPITIITGTKQITTSCVVFDQSIDTNNYLGFYLSI